MSDSFLDHLPSSEREKIRKRMRSPEAYERLREKVKGPEDLAQEMERSEKLAELHFTLESEPAVNDSLKNAIEQDVREQGIENLFEATHLSPEIKNAIEHGKFSVSVESHPDTQEDALVVMPEGHVQEKIPVKQTFSDQYVGQFTMHH